jgi:hypothetical protein
MGILADIGIEVANYVGPFKVAAGNVGPYSVVEATNSIGPYVLNIVDSVRYLGPYTIPSNNSAIGPYKVT